MILAEEMDEFVIFVWLRLEFVEFYLLELFVLLFDELLEEMGEMGVVELEELVVELFMGLMGLVCGEVVLLDDWGDFEGYRKVCWYYFR